MKKTEKQLVIENTIKILREKGMLKESEKYPEGTKYQSGNDYDDIKLREIQKFCRQELIKEKGGKPNFSLVFTRANKENYRYKIYCGVSNVDVQNLQLEINKKFPGIICRKGNDTQGRGEMGLNFYIPNSLILKSSQNLEEKKKVVMETISFLRKKGLLKEAAEQEGDIIEFKNNNNKILKGKIRVLETDSDGKEIASVITKNNNGEQNFVSVFKNRENEWEVSNEDSSDLNETEKKKVVMETLSFLRKKGLLAEAEKEEEFTHEVEFQGGSIGEKKNHKKFKSAEEASEYAKRMNKVLTPGEKSHYKMKYVVKPIKKSKKISEPKQPLKENALVAAAIGAGVPALALTGAFIASVKNYMKENPGVKLIAAIKAIYKSTGEGAHAIKDNIG